MGAPPAARPCSPPWDVPGTTHPRTVRPGRRCYAFGMEYSIETRQGILARLSAGESISAVAKDSGVSRKTIRTWRDAAGLTAEPAAEGASILDLPAGVAIGVLDRISAGDVRSDDPPVTFREYLESTRILEPSRNQRRLAEKNQSDAGLTREEATDFVRDVLWEIGQRFGATGSGEAVEQHARLLEWTIERIRRVNPTLAMEL